MMPLNPEVKLFFVPCSPKGTNTENPEDKAPISWQKHASRQYHQGNKSKKPQNPTPSSSTRRRVTPSRVRQIQSKDHETVELTTRPASSPSHDTPFHPIGSVASNQLDPFGVIIRPDTPRYALEILQHGIQFMWNAYDRGTGAGKIKETILTSSMMSPATFYTIVFAAAAHNAFGYSRERVPEQNKLLRITYKGLALSHLRRELEELNAPIAVTDHLLLCMVVLAAHNDAENLLPPPEEHRMKGTLAKAQDNQYYGTLTWEPAHLVTLRTLVKTRGGLETVVLPGVREMIAVWKQLQCPVFPLFHPIEDILSRLQRYHPSIGSSHYFLPFGFHKLLDIDDLQPILRTVCYLQLAAISYDDLERQLPYASPLKDVYVGCNAVLHEMLSHDRVNSHNSDSGYGSVTPSPTSNADEFGSSDMINNVVHALIRFACLTYIVQVLFPFPQAAGIQAKLMSAVRETLEQLKLLGGFFRYPELTLWATVLGGTVASRDSRFYFAQAYLSCETSQEMFGPYAFDTSDEARWSHAINICRRFLWHESPDSPLQRELKELQDDISLIRRGSLTPTQSQMPLS